jgi:hypothetical protein
VSLIGDLYFLADINHRKQQHQQQNRGLGSQKEFDNLKSLNDRRHTMKTYTGPLHEICREKESKLSKEFVRCIQYTDTWLPEATCWWSAWTAAEPKPNSSQLCKK